MPSLHSIAPMCCAAGSQLSSQGGNGSIGGTSVSQSLSGYDEWEGMDPIKQPSYPEHQEPVSRDCAFPDPLGAFQVVSSSSLAAL